MDSPSETVPTSCSNWDCYSTNKAKADQLEQICRQTDNTDLWDRYQTTLQQSNPNLLLQDRPDLIQRLSMELGDRAVEKIRINCPPDQWTVYENK
ncbi:hypothetical protein IV203_004628 [Nitzschia inconspicua]|uniref:Uncharacterized protein n=1 Tax=Nitzschia inconspicua TaxID=303405 RepID=A0A9K3PPV7_9STRA|nr:hypothetical protein IV203_004628 [Nitzschia inconspicua]